MASVRLSERLRGDGNPEIDRSNSPQDPPIYTWDHLRREMNQEWCDRLRGSRLLFVRHGLTWYNIQNKVSGTHNTKLSRKGIEQARMLAARLSETHIDVVFSSDLDRALKTAEIFLKETKLPTKIRLDPRLREVNLGVIQGTVRQYLVPFESGDIDFRPEKGESYRDAARRVASFILDAAKLCRGRERNTTIAAFTHTGVMRIIGAFLGVAKDPRDLFRQNYVNTEFLVCGFDELHIRLSEGVGMPFINNNLLTRAHQQSAYETAYQNDVLERYDTIRENHRHSISTLETVTALLTSQLDLLQECNSVVVFGSYARRDASRESDFDNLVLTTSEQETNAKEVSSALNRILADLGIPLPNLNGVFGGAVYAISKIDEGIGGVKDDYNSMSRRLLLLLESRPIFGPAVHGDVVERLVKLYGRDVEGDPRKNYVLLLNDLIRYFRTICVRQSDRAAHRTPHRRREFQRSCLHPEAGEGERPAVIVGYGEFLQTVFDFTIIALAIFMMIKALNKLKRQEPPPPAAPPEPTKEEQLLTEIRDILKSARRAGLKLETAVTLSKRVLPYGLPQSDRSAVCDGARPIVTPEKPTMAFRNDEGCS